MKNPKVTNHTGVFQSMIENYRKNSSNILYQRKLAKSLNNYILKDINKIKIKDNFPDEDYFINEIKLENKMKSKVILSQNINKKAPEISNNSNTDKINKDIFFYYKYRINGEDKNELNSIQNFKKNLKSLKSHNTISSAKKSNSSNRKNSLATIILPLINLNNGNSKTPYKKQFKTIANEDDEPDKKVKSKIYERISPLIFVKIDKLYLYKINKLNIVVKKELKII